MGQIIKAEVPIRVPRRGEPADIAEELAEIADSAGSECVDDRQVIRMWCGLLPADDNRYDSILGDFESLIPGQRVLYPELLHAGILEAGKQASLVPDTNPRTSTLYSLQFILPIREANNPQKIKPLPVPHDKLVVGDDTIVATLAERLRVSTGKTNREGTHELYRVDTYLRVARTMRSLGWDISGGGDISSVEQLRHDFKNFADNGVGLWVEHAAEMPKAILESLLDLSVQIGEDQTQRSINTVAAHVSESLAVNNNSTKAVGQKAVAAYTTFIQKNSQNTHYTRNEALTDLLARS